MSALLKVDGANKPSSGVRLPRTGKQRAVLLPFAFLPFAIGDFSSEPSAYRILKAADLITAPDYVVITGPGRKRPDVPKANHALTFNLGHSKWGCSR